MNILGVQKGYSFTAKADYDSIEGLEDAFGAVGVEPVDIECLITAYKDGESGDKYCFNYYCGLGEYESQLFQGSMATDVKDTGELETCALEFLDNLLDNTDWMDILRDYKRKHEPDVFEEWLESQDGLNLKWAVEYYAQDAKGLSLQMSYNDGEIYTSFVLKTSDKELPLPGYIINSEQNPVEKRKAAKDNYEVYLKLLQQFFGMEPFMDSEQIMGFDTYMEAIQKCISDDADSFHGVGICIDEEHFRVEMCKQMVEGTTMQIITKGCEECPNRECSMHP